MRFDCFSLCAQPPGWSEDEVFEAAIGYADEAERLGFGGIWLLEHHFTRYGICPSPITMAAFLLGRTSTLRVGTAVSIVTLDHPIRLAEQVALLDRISRGRFDFGVGRGIGSKDFAVFGADPAGSDAVMREWTDVITRAWTEDTVAGHGPALTFPAVPVYPTPRTLPHPPLYAAAESPSTVRWAAAIGLPMLLAPHLTPEKVASQVELYELAAREVGRDARAVQHAVSRIVFVDDTEQQARDAITPFLEWWSVVAEQMQYTVDEFRSFGNYDFHVRGWEDMVLGSSSSVGDARTRSVESSIDNSPVGTVEHCIEELNAIVDETPIRHVICGFEGVADGPRALEAMRRFAEEVAPEVRAHAAGLDVPVDARR